MVKKLKESVVKLMEKAMKRPLAMPANITELHPEDCGTGQSTNRGRDENGNVKFKQCIPEHDIHHDQIVVITWSR